MVNWKVGTSIVRIAWALAGSLKTTDLQGGTNAIGTYPLSFKLAATLPISPPPMFALASPSQHCSSTQHACLWACSNQRIEESIVRMLATDYMQSRRDCDPCPSRSRPLGSLIGCRITVQMKLEVRGGT